MFGITLGQDWLNATLPQRLAMWFGVVSPVSLQPLRTPARTAALATHRRDRLDQRKKLRHVVSVGTCHRGGQRNAVGIRHEVMLAARFCSIRRAGACFFPPCTARTLEESMIARDQSIWSAPCKWANSASWTFFQTPRFCQACKRRHAVIPEPQPNSCGRCSQGRPVLSTNRIAHNALRLSIGLRPGYRRRRFFGSGKSASITSHNLSSKIGLAMTTPPCAAMNLARGFQFT
jgi:hypothetical protein